MLTTGRTGFWRSLPFLFLAVVPSGAFAHEEGESRVVIELKSPDQIQAGAADVSFQLLDAEAGKPVTPADLNVTHEKRLHLIAYDPALKEFQHVHPEFDGQVWRAAMRFAVDGDYFVWAQGELAADSQEFSAMVRLRVRGGLPTWPTPVLGEVLSNGDSGSVASLDAGVLHAGRMAMLILRLTKEDGSPSQITPYLGAFAHVIATPEDGASLLHVHPMNGSQPNEGMVHVTFPAAGFYRLWVQFIDSGILKTVPLSVSVVP